MDWLGIAIVIALAVLIGVQTWRYLLGPNALANKMRASLKETANQRFGNKRMEAEAQLKRDCEKGVPADQALRTYKERLKDAEEAYEREVREAEWIYNALRRMHGENE